MRAVPSRTSNLGVSAAAYNPDPWRSAGDAWSRTPSNNPNNNQPANPNPSVRTNSTRSDSVRDFDGGYGNAANKRPRANTQSHSATAAPRTQPSTAAHTTSEPYAGRTGNGNGNGASSSPPPPSMDALLADLSPEEQRTVKMFQANSPSVVNVNTTRAAMPGTLLNPFFMQQMPRGVGSGFIWDTKGHVITNAHVIANASEVTVTLSDGTMAKAKVIGKDREKDIAVLQITDLPAERVRQLKPVSLGSSSNLLVGQKVYAIGNPFGLDQTLTQGIVSGLGREVGGGLPGSPMGMRGPTITNGIQTDTAINPGNSGGPMLDSNGRVVGINTAILDPTGVGISSGVGFAIPIDAVRGMVDQILTVGRIVRPALGISIAPVPPMLQQYARSLYGSDANDKSDKGGVLVVSVRPGGPADVAGVKSTRREMFGQLMLGDVITALNGKPVRQQKDLFSILDSLKVGDGVELSLLSPQTGGKRTVKVVLADREKLAWSE